MKDNKTHIVFKKRKNNISGLIRKMIANKRIK